MHKKTHYHVYAGDVQRRPATVKTARKVIRQMISQGLNPICDKVQEIQRKHISTRVYRHAEPKLDLIKVGTQWAGIR
jgi:hypothetical protein